MARYRFFGWDHVPAALAADLARGLRAGDDDAPVPGDDALPVVRLRRVYGDRPGVALVADRWRVLLDRWLAHDDAARVAVVERLAEARLGDRTIDTASRLGQLDYLRSCRNAQTLREVVLEAFLAAGEPPYEPPLAGGLARTLDHVAPPSGELVEWVLRTLGEVFGVPVAPDPDGDIAIPRGSSATYVRVEPDVPMVRVFAHLVQHLDAVPELYEAANAISEQVPLAKAVVVAERRAVVLGAELLATTLSAHDLVATLDVVSHAADHFDTLLAARFGGYLRRPDDPVGP